MNYVFLEDERLRLLSWSSSSSAAAAAGTTSLAPVLVVIVLVVVITYGQFHSNVKNPTLHFKILENPRITYSTMILKRYLPDCCQNIDTCFNYNLNKTLKLKWSYFPIVDIFPNSNDMQLF